MMTSRGIISRVVLVVFILCWFWSLGFTGSVLAAEELKKDTIAQEKFNQLRVGEIKHLLGNEEKKDSPTKLAKPFNKVKTYQKKQHLKLIEAWPYRQEINCQVQKCVALTFDDGPGDQTGQLLDILYSKQVMATFFVLGLQIPSRETTLQRMIDQGHEIGNHSYSHKKFKELNSQQIAEEIGTTQNLIYSATGYRPHIVRPPIGEYNLGDTTLNGYPIILWNADPSDWKNHNSKIIEQEVLAQVKPGSIILMHDIYQPSIEAVTPLIDNLKNQGYTFVTVSELMGWKNAGLITGHGQALRSR